MPLTKEKRKELLDWIVTADLKSVQLKKSDKHVLSWLLGPDGDEDDAKIELKYNFGGSGQKAWKTSLKKEKRTILKDKTVIDKDKMGSEPVMEDSRIRKYEKTKVDGEDYDLKIEVEYAGPMGGGGSGLLDTGRNSTISTLDDAENDFNKKMEAIVKLKGSFDNKVSVKVKGFSRGATAAAKFVNKISEGYYATQIDVKLALFDPVHGGGTGAKGGSLASKQPHQQELTSSPAVTGSVRILPMQSGYKMDAFRPQAIRGVKTVCIVYGKNAGHDSGQFGEYTYDGTVLKGSKWNDIPEGLWMVDSTKVDKKNPSAHREEIQVVQDFEGVERLFNKVWKVTYKEPLIGFFSGKVYRKGKYKAKISKMTSWDNRDIELLELCEAFFPGSEYIAEYKKWYESQRLTKSPRTKTTTVSPPSSEEFET